RQGDLGRCGGVLKRPARRQRLGDPGHGEIRRAVEALMDTGPIGKADTEIGCRLQQDANVVADTPVVCGELEAAVCRLRQQAESGARAAAKTRVETDAAEV